MDVDPVVHAAQQAAFRAWQRAGHCWNRAVSEAVETARREMAEFLVKSAARHGVNDRVLERHLSAAACWQPSAMLEPGETEERAFARGNGRRFRYSYETSQLQKDH